MHRKIITLAVLAALSVPVPALAEDGEGRRLAELAFSSVDGADRGFIDYGEFSNFGKDVFVSMDSDESDKITLKEFLSWGFGMQLVAEEAGRAEAYETAMRVVFAFWDRNGDNELTKSEYNHALAGDFRRADFDNDAFLSKEEFLSGFSVIVAERAAINPPPAK